VFRFGEEIDADVRMANGILVISFKTKVSPRRRLSTTHRLCERRTQRSGRLAVRIALGAR